MALQLVWSDEQMAFPISEPLIQRLEQLLRLAGEQEGVAEGEVALTFVDDEAIHALNLQYRGMDKPTDVLSFAMSEMGEDEPGINYTELLEPGDAEGGADPMLLELLGDIVISVPRAIAQSEEYGHSVERELGFLFVHGFLHLIGYDHETAEDEKAMFARQEEVLLKAGLSR